MESALIALGFSVALAVGLFAGYVMGTKQYSMSLTDKTLDIAKEAIKGWQKSAGIAMPEAGDEVWDFGTVVIRSTEPTDDGYVTRIVTKREEAA